ncbi:MAG: MBL fold metallo-hydrolase [Acidimicrobiales bacterium]|nr:MAG: MBL fold metallo-hydrolase [Acidimicrobiales bacterium]
MTAIRFFGVRGSTPCSCEENRRYGGNTACVVLEAAGSEPIVLDLGTGLRLYGRTFAQDEPFRGHVLVTHLHWDHVQGLPFFEPINRTGARMDLWGPKQEDGTSLETAFRSFMAPPYFPVGLEAFAGEFEFHDLGEDEVSIGDAKVRVRFVPHIGPTCGFRVELDGVSVAYIPDHQQPLNGAMTIDDAVLELCEGVDVLIHDAQYTEEEWARKSHWGHCTISYALHVARESGAKRLVLFHHDPAHSDELVDRVVEEMRDSPKSWCLEQVVAAHEGLELELGASSGPGVSGSGEREAMR